MQDTLITWAFVGPDKKALPTDEVPMTDALRSIIEGCKFLGMHGIINEYGAREYYIRAVVAALTGDTHFDGVCFEDVQKAIGLRTNLVSKSRAAFFASINQQIETTAMLLISANLPSKPISTIAPDHIRSMKL